MYQKNWFCKSWERFWACSLLHFKVSTWFDRQDSLLIFWPFQTHSRLSNPVRHCKSLNLRSWPGGNIRKHSFKCKEFTKFFYFCNAVMLWPKNSASQRVCNKAIFAFCRRRIHLLHYLLRSPLYDQRYLIKLSGIFISYFDTTEFLYFQIEEPDRLFAQVLSTECSTCWSNIKVSPRNFFSSSFDIIWDVCWYIRQMDDTFWVGTHATSPNSCYLSQLWENVMKDKYNNKYMGKDKDKNVGE